MRNNLWKYYKDYIRRNLITRFNIIELNYVAKIEYVMVKIKLSEVASLEDISILEMVECIEKLTSQKCMVKDLGSIKGKRGYSKGKNVECFVTLRKKRMYNFIKYLIMIIMPLNIKRYGLLKLNEVGKGVYMLRMTDINSFYKLKLNNYNNEAIDIYFKLTGHNKQHKILLKSLGLKFN